MAEKSKKYGVMSREDFKKRTIAIAKGEYKPKKNEPEIYFESEEARSKSLSNKVLNSERET